MNRSPRAPNSSRGALDAPAVRQTHSPREKNRGVATVAQQFVRVATGPVTLDGDLAFPAAHPEGIAYHSAATTWPGWQMKHLIEEL